MSHNIQNRHADALSRVALLVVHRPGDYAGDGGEETRCCWVDECVAQEAGPVVVAAESDQAVAETAQGGVEEDEGGASAGAVGEIGC